MKLSFGEFLASRRKEKGLTQKDLANLLYVSESAVSKWEQNRANPDITIVPTLANILGVSEHELITASVDYEQRENNKQAKKWKHLTFSWNLFFLISYGIALFTCFICNIAINHTLSWFWIVLTALMLSASLTTLPLYIKKFKLLILSITPLICLVLLLAVCSIYTGGNWFLVAIVPTIVSFIMVFLPIYIKKYNFPMLIKRHKWLLCVILDFLLLILIMYIVEDFTYCNNYTPIKWVLRFALPITSCCFVLALFVIFVLQYLRINKWLKLGLTTSIFALVWLPMQILINSLLFRVFGLEKPITYIPDLTKWYTPYINNNISFLVILSLIVLSIICIVVGLIKSKKSSLN